jgi:glycosyltransferase involved in cell wall biosynthesis
MPMPGGGLRPVKQARDVLPLVPKGGNLYSKLPMPPALLPLSAFIICKDEADYIENCIRSLDMCSEIVVVDSGSTDGTLDLLARLEGEGFPLVVLHNDWPGYARQKQFALEQCTQDWCLSVDADERLDEDLRRALPAMLSSDAAGWLVRRRNYLIGYGYPPKDAAEHHLLRIVRRGQARFDLDALVHEGMSVDGRTEKAPGGSLLHYRPLFLHEQILKENAYSTLKADQKQAAQRRPRPIKMLVSPILYFLRLYFGHRLFRCGWAGFIEASTGAVYAFLTEAKLVQHALVRQTPVAEPKDFDV